MNRLFLFGIVFLLFASVVNAQTITILKQDPSPAEPGKPLEIWLSVATSDIASENFEVQIVEGYPFSLASGEEATHFLGRLTREGANTRYRLIVAPDTPEGDAVLAVMSRSNGGSWSEQERTIPIVAKPRIEVFDIRPVEIIPGRPANITFFLHNVGAAPARDIVFSWNDPTGNILPLGAENTRLVSSLDVGEAIELTFGVVADPGTDEGVHLINVSMATQRFGTTETKTASVALIVGGLTDFDVSQSEFEDTTLSLSIANIGVNTATATTITINDQPGWNLLGGETIFLGNLNPGDFTVASFQIERQDGVDTVDVKIYYTDTTGVRRVMEKNARVIQQPTRAVAQQPSIFPYLVIMVVLIVAGLWYRSRSHRHRKK